MAGNAGYSTDSGGTSQNTIKSVEHNAKQKLKKTKTEYTENKELANLMFLYSPKLQASLPL